MAEQAAPTETPPPRRLASLDAYRGLTMLLLAFTAARWGWEQPIAEAFPSLRPLTDQVEHVAWRGLTLWDLIQPSFMFMVGVSLPYSIASRRRRGATDGEMWRHAAKRALLLVLLGVFLRSVGRDETHWTLEDVVSQIGLGYLPLFWLATRSPKIQWTAIGAVLVVTWALFAFWPLAEASNELVVRHFDGFWAHWNENVGPGIALDQWLLNLPPRSEPFVVNEGGYYTLNFLPSLATMALGLLAGEQLRREATEGERLRWLAAWGAALLVLGVAMDLSGLCPLVKKVWTPSFALASGGLCLLILAALYAVIDVLGVRRWAWPAEVVGRNPLAMYIMTWTLAGWVAMNLRTHFGAAPFSLLGETYAPLLENLTVGLILWLVCWWMDRNKVYLRL